MKLSYDTLLYWFEHDDRFPIDETSFYFEDDPERKERFLGCLRQYEKPYWAGYCDSPEGMHFKTASELFEAPIWDGKSIRDRWEQTVILEIGGISSEEWMNMHGSKL